MEERFLIEVRVDGGWKEHSRHRSVLEAEREEMVMREIFGHEVRIVEVKE